MESLEKIDIEAEISFDEINNLISFNRDYFYQVYVYKGEWYLAIGIPQKKQPKASSVFKRLGILPDALFIHEKPLELKPISMNKKFKKQFLEYLEGDNNAN